MQSLAHPMALGDYEVVRRVDSSDQGFYLAHRPGAGEKKVVLAAFDLTDDQVEQLTEELARCQELSHPAIIQAVDRFEDGGQQVLVFESFEGLSLLGLQRQLAAQEEQLPDRAIMHLGKELADALDQAHSRPGQASADPPIVHGQLGPHQVFVTWDGEVKLFGFGLSVLFPAPDTDEGRSPWVAPCLAPEVRDGGPLTAQANAYAAAAILWSLFVGKLPPADGAPQRIRTLRADLPLLLCSGLGRALEVEPKRRVNCRALGRTFGRVVKPADQSELQWTMESLRPLTPEQDVFLVEVFPPRDASLPPPSRAPESSLPPPEEGSSSSSPPPWTEPPDSQDEPTNPFFRVPAHLANLKLPDSVIPDDEEDDELATDSDRVAAGEGDSQDDPVSTQRSGKSDAVRELGEDDVQSDDEPAGGRRVRLSRDKSAVFKARRRASESAGGKAAKLGAGQARKPRPRIQSPDHKLIGRKPRPKLDGKRSAPKPEDREPPVVAVEEASEAQGSPRPFEVEASPVDPSAAAGATPATIPDYEMTGRAALASAHQTPGAPPPRVDPPSPLGAPALPDRLDGEPQAHEIADDPSQAIPPPPLSTRPEVPPFPAPTGTPHLMEDQAPPSQRGPLPNSVAPTGEPYSAAPPSVPYSLAPPYSFPPGSIPPQGAVALPAKWLTGVAVVVAVTALASFALGLLVASGGLQISLKGKSDEPTVQPTQRPPAPVPPPSPTAKPAAPAPTAPTAASVKEGDDASADGKDGDTADDGRDGSNLPRNRGFLVVNSSEEDAVVYVYGARVGKVGEKLEVQCGVRFVRLGTYPLTGWIGKGRRSTWRRAGQARVRDLGP
ncbi:MAG: protein kinase [Deltaproteobacteria bacterium]|nr:protein kinase [Deltaproteobacteria bacterium]